MQLILVLNLASNFIHIMKNNKELLINSNKNHQLSLTIVWNVLMEVLFGLVNLTNLYLMRLN